MDPVVVLVLVLVFTISRGEARRGEASLGRGRVLLPVAV